MATHKLKLNIGDKIFVDCFLDKKMKIKSKITLEGFDMVIPEKTDKKIKLKSRFSICNY